jgi:hypothetical protein
MEEPKKVKEIYIRVRGDYFKKIVNQDVRGWLHDDLVGWKREAIIDDYDKKSLQDIPKFDTFTNIPVHGDAKIDINSNLYNLYQPVKHDLQPGDWIWTERLLRHIFGDQYELGLDYIQLLYQHPLQILPILCLVSKENATGKTTFLNWLKQLFLSNMIVVGNHDIEGNFNSHFATKLIIAVDESRIDKARSLEKMKAMATQTHILFEGKFQNKYVIPFFGKIILCSNYEDNFISASDEDVRYWVRKVPLPKHINVEIEKELEREVPAFLYDLSIRRMSTDKRHRAWFSPDQIETDALKKIKYQSKNWLYKEIDEMVISHFIDNPTIESFRADATDIKQAWFSYNKDANIAFIRRTLKNDFKMESTMSRYLPFEDYARYPDKRSGRSFLFERKRFMSDPELNGNDALSLPETVKEITTKVNAEQIF